MLPHPKAKMGRFYDNPMRKDVEAIGRMLDVDYVLNIVMNNRKEILHVLWGDPHAVIEAGIPLALASSRIEKKPIAATPVIASPADIPKISTYIRRKRPSPMPACSVKKAV